MAQVAKLPTGVAGWRVTMTNKICTALADAARFRAERGEIDRAEMLLKKATQIAHFGGSPTDKFFSWIHVAHFLEDQNRDEEAERAYRKAIDSVPMIDFNVRHAIALKELGELVMRTGRPEEGLALQAIAFRVFDVLADDIAQKSVESVRHLTA